jgi:hypothetical protein
VFFDDGKESACEYSCLKFLLEDFQHVFAVLPITSSFSEEGFFGSSS